MEPVPNPVGAQGQVQISGGIATIGTTNVSSPLQPKPSNLSDTVKSIQNRIATNALNNGSVAAPKMSTGIPGTVPTTALGMRPTATPVQTNSSQVLDRKRLQELVKEVDPLEQLDDDVEEMMLQIADDFIDNVANAACQFAKHRQSSTVEVKDVQLHLERNWNIWIPGFGTEDIKPYKKAATTEAHKQRLALIKKTLKKY